MNHLCTFPYIGYINREDLEARFMLLLNLWATAMSRKLSHRNPLNLS